jgi:Mg2+-importing ATPase
MGKISPVDGLERGIPDLATAASIQPGDVVALLDSSLLGLTSTQAEGRLRQFGPNVLAEHRVTAFGVLARQLRNPLLILLLSAAAISTTTGEVSDGAIIGAIVVLSVGLGFVNEYRTELAVAALHANIRHEAVVWRDGEQRRTDVRDLVPGDVVELHVGHLVPADMRLVSVNELECDEAVRVFS